MKNFATFSKLILSDTDNYRERTTEDFYFIEHYEEQRIENIFYKFIHVLLARL